MRRLKDKRGKCSRLYEGTSLSMLLAKPVPCSESVGGFSPDSNSLFPSHIMPVERSSKQVSIDLISRERGKLDGKAAIA